MGSASLAVPEPKPSLSRIRGQPLLAVRAQLVLIPIMLFWESSWRFIVVRLVLRLYVFQIPGNAYARMGCSIKLTFLYKIC